MHALWTEKYRPRTLSDYVFQTQAQRETVEGWVKSGSIGHLMLYGPPGTGKTTLARVLVNELGVDEFDFLQINASRDNGAEFIRNKVEGFISTLPFGKFKVVLLDESDLLSPTSQGILRGLMETYADTSRFILTCNYPNKIIAPLHSRCQSLHIDKTDITEFTARIAGILLEESVEFDLDDLDTYVRAAYPDLRKCINLCQQSVKNSVLERISSDTGNSSRDYRLELVELVKQRRYPEARALLASQIRGEDLDELFRWMYDNIDIWSATAQGQDQAILIIKQGIVNNNFIADAEINVSAVMIELSLIDQ